MWRTMFFLLAAFLCFSTVNGSSLRIPDYWTCYKSTDPAALNASLLYDDHSASGELWKRDDLQKPLPPCSDIIDALFNGPCEVCRGEQVFAVCRNLSESVDLRMEGSSNIQISRCECDQLIQKAETPTAAPTAAPTADPTTALTAVSIIIIISLIVGLAVYFKNCRKRRSENKQDPEAAAMKPLNGGQPTDVMTVDEIPNGRG
ncbi:uncharacterized protein LOC111947384 [Oryzias latipes]|uniref:uncharacterized protein LOC111947384 n=1 Tax=Oryzias latipes TaxID=8090 RepID=UPI0002A4B8D4|nr:uncharacterized protein LOC111947384 [Oryzias latipes]XP_023810204.1 uncharacterized protein LOC111947384 [Oryzias latipes]XP_023810205.1 uncharacterized protein LOC111947384 [Oryzias latipes]XP_023810206.1 uncharacterized protein LOC111947384 [Oryzias latipes]